MALPAFARKPQIAHHATTTNVTPFLGASLRAPNGDKLSKSSGAITPLAHDSVFCSTSESSDNEGTGHRTKAKLNMSSTVTVRPTAGTRATRSGRPSLPAEFSKSAGASLRAPSYLMSKEYAERKKSQSPVSPIAGVVASSSSSRSREDIISWAKAVKSRPGDAPDTSEDESRGRGRSRTRREGTTETVREVTEEENLATTPKGRIESVLGGLTIGRFGVGPIVKALTSVTGSTAAAQRPPFEHKASNSSAFTSAPAPAEVSKVAVVSSTAIATGGSGYALEDNQIFFGGATPTLSTVSLSEVNEPPSIATDPVDHDANEYMMRDDQSISVASSSQLPHRRRSGPPARESLAKNKQQAASKTQQSQTNVSPLRPIQSTASVIWNISSYLRSFTPFTLPQPTSSTRSSNETSPHKETPSTEVSEQTSMSVASPMPASRMPSRAPSPTRELVRSLPMNIIAPGSSTNTNYGNDERERHREAQDYIEAMAAKRSRSRQSRSKRPSRSRGRSPSNRPIVPAHTRNWSYDADQSEDEGLPEPGAAVVERRGRSPQAKALVGEDQCAVQVELFSQQAPAERSWSRPREADLRASRSRGRRESPRGRGRDRTVRGI